MRQVSGSAPFTNMLRLIPCALLLCVGHVPASSETASDIAKCLANLGENPLAIDQFSMGDNRTGEDPCWHMTATVHDDGSPVNAQAQFLHGVTKLRQAYDLSGEPITVGVWDGGSVLATHTEFGNRVTLKDEKSEESGDGKKKDVYIHHHATHVAGTIGAAGVDPRLQGMAPKVRILSYYWDNDVAELQEAVGLGVTITNHSYGSPGGWSFIGGKCRWRWFGWDDQEDSIFFGLYDTKAAQFDDIVYRNPNLSIFKSAGNERDWDAEPDLIDASIVTSGDHCALAANGGLIQSKKKRPRDTRKGGYDTMTGVALAKNVITVGAMADLAADWTPKNIKVTHFSSFGPVDDGRIKPDVIANGEWLASTSTPSRCVDKWGNDICHLEDIKSGELSAWQEMPGTSMASPVAAGIGALLNELALKKRERQLFADEMKAVLIHTATSPREFNGIEGPTYDAGWGVIQALAAGNLVAEQHGWLERAEIKKGNTLDLPLEWTEQRSTARITAVWLDLPGVPEEEGKIDSNTPVLRNRLAVTLLSPDGKTFYPWSLNPVSPKAPPVNDRSNTVDNVNRIDVPAHQSKSGIWHLRIDANALESDDLKVAIAYYGLQPKKQ